MKHLFLLAFAVIIFTSCTSTPESNIKEIASNYYKKGAFNGTLLVARDGKILCDTVLGYRDLQTKQPVNDSTVFYIASLAKPFTALTIMQLKEQHKLEYENTISLYMSDLPPFAQKITIRQLLNHTSGIPDYEKEMAPVKNLTNTQVMQWLGTKSNLNFSPGDKFEYSNTGYIILASIIEKISGKSYADFLKEAVFHPLNLKRTIVYDTTKPTITNRAIGYNKDKKLDDYSILTTGDGSIFSTAKDLFAWEEALYGQKLMSKKEMENACQPAKLNDGSISNYGFGWNIQEKEGHTIVSHTGGLNGYRACIWRNLHDKTVIIVLTNQGDAFPLQQFMQEIENEL
ncbi:CubicO group peptidase (beta-lactamase class C family) [Flavobacterium endophyticum]|uniref:CubicO group peptidase (Beta-lactamase class C family) n=1 Tax=Flavobacterium endophyticum TaxID=1540163 RepID=A0A495MI19_9FLAO|nr:serine hydrolase domain-containing protein [Flavobacterium endophyticum]RKS24985.1 CubicO group peptidase (beta-lactamase class C family) [Flavobacterium endophyticum]